VVFDERGEALDPIAIVAVEKSVHVPDLGVVDVAAHDALHAALARLAHDRVLEVPDVTGRTLDLQLEVA